MAAHLVVAQHPPACPPAPTPPAPASTNF